MLKNHNNNETYFYEGNVKRLMLRCLLVSRKPCMPWKPWPVQGWILLGKSKNPKRLEKESLSFKEKRLVNRVSCIFSLHRYAPTHQHYSSWLLAPNPMLFNVTKTTKKKKAKQEKQK